MLLIFLQLLTYVSCDLLGGNEIGASVDLSTYFRFGNIPDGKTSTSVSSCRTLDLVKSQVIPGNFKGFKFSYARLWMYAPSAVGGDSDNGSPPSFGNPPSSNSVPMGLTCNVGVAFFELSNTFSSVGNGLQPINTAPVTLNTNSFVDSGKSGFNGLKVFYVDLDLSSLNTDPTYNGVPGPGDVSNGQTFETQDFRVWVQSCTAGTTSYNLFAASGTTSLGDLSGIYSYGNAATTACATTSDVLANPLNLYPVANSNVQSLPVLMAVYGNSPVTPSTSPTSTPTVTPTATRTRVPSLTPTASITATTTISRSLTSSQTKLAVTPSTSPTRTRPLSLTPSPTPSITSSTTKSLTRTSSSTTTPSNPTQSTSGTKGSSSSRECSPPPLHFL